ncbi:MAG: aminotransferase class V-fold PLP-dependent enzyme [Planctomycetota bacterium]
MAYLNHAGTSWPKPAVVRDAVANALRQPASTWNVALAFAHRRVADAFGVADAERLLLTPGCTSALSVGITDLPWERGDRVLTSSLEHHALHRPITQLAERGVEVRSVPRAVDGPLDLGILREELARGGVRLVAMTAACNVTGELLPYEDVIERAHERGALCLLDAAQIAGWFPLDVEALRVDLLAFAGHKALHAPWGIGGLYVAPQVRMATQGAQCELPSSGTGHGCETMPGHCDAGSVDRAALAGLSAALDWLDEPDRADRLERARGLIERVASALEGRPGVTLHGARDPERRLPSLALTIEGRSSAELAAALARRGVIAAGGLQCAPNAHAALGTAPDGVLRISAGPGNDEQDVARAIEALSAC